MTGNKEFGKPTDGSPGKSTMDRERKSRSKMSVFFTEDALLFSPWWKRSSIINLLSGDCWAPCLVDGPISVAQH